MKKDKAIATPSNHMSLCYMLSIQRQKLRSKKVK